MSTGAAAKRTLRARIRALLAALSAEERRERGARAARRLLELAEVRRARRWLLFRSLADEIDTSALFEAGRADGRRLYAPRVVGVELHFVAVDLATAWMPGAYPVLEPAGGPVLEARDLAAEPSMILVPGLAFGEHGERLGRGGGHYDRALASLRRAVPDLLALSLALDVQIVDALPLEPHDQPVDLVVTETRTLRR